jgi:hypothetical protein
MADAQGRGIDAQNWPQSCITHYDASGAQAAPYC